MTTASMGWAAQLGTVTESTYGVTPGGGVVERFVFVNESLARRGLIIPRDGIRGSRSAVANDTRQGPYRVVGSVLLEPTPADLSIWLPRILGAAPSGSTFALAGALPSFSLSVDRVAKVFTYAGCKVNRATFAGEKGGLVRLRLDIVGQSESVATAGSFPTLTASTEAGPYLFAGDPTLTLNSVTREVQDFELAIDNGLVTDRFMNSLTVVNLPEGDRAVTLRTRHAWASANVDLYNQALAGAPGTLAFANGGSSTTFSFGTLQVPANSPTTPGKSEILLTLDMVARQTGGTLELTVSNTAA
jgi:hypothetical protein